VISCDAGLSLKPAVWAPSPLSVHWMVKRATLLWTRCQWSTYFIRTIQQYSYTLLLSTTLFEWFHIWAIFKLEQSLRNKFNRSVVYWMRTVHLRGYLNKFSPPYLWERLIYLDVSTIHISRHFAQTSASLVLCLLREHFVNLNNVFRFPRFVRLEG